VLTELLTDYLLASDGLFWFVHCHGNLVAGCWQAMDVCSASDIPAFYAARHSIFFKL
jgi:hypothetical protein